VLPMVAISDDLSFVESHGERLKLESPARSSKNDKKNGGKKREIINLPQNISEVILGFLCKGNNNNGIGDQKCRPIFLAGSLRT